MAKSIIRPMSDTIPNGWEGGGTQIAAWDRLDEIIADDIDTFIIETGEAGFGFTWRCGLQDHNLDPAVTVNDVTYYWRGAIGGLAGATADLFAHDGTTQHNQLLGQNFGNDFAWQTVSLTATLAPDLGAWTLAKVNLLEMGAVAIGIGGGRSILVTQCYAEIDYDPVNAAPEGMSAGMW